MTSVALGLYLVYNAVMVKEPEIMMDFKKSARTVVAAQPEDIRPARRADFGAYADVFKKRDFFENPLAQQSKGNQAVNVVKQNPDVNLNTQYKLVGIILDGRPQAIVEDLIKKETLFLSVDDKLGDAVLKEIKDLGQATR